MMTSNWYLWRIRQDRNFLPCMWQMIMKEMGADHMKIKQKEAPKQENKYKKILRQTFRKIIPNKNDLKRNYAKRSYDAAIRVYGK